MTPRQKYRRKREYIMSKPNRAVEIFESYSHGFYKMNNVSDFRNYSWNENITWEMINAKPSILWDWDFISRNPHITWKIVMENEHLLWSWRWLSHNPNISWKNVLKRINKDWSWDGLSEHINITWDIIRANPDKPWNNYFVSRNPNITFEIVKQNESYAWNLNGLLSNPNITMEMLEFIEQKAAVVKFPLDWREFTNNDAITWEMVLVYKKQLKNNLYNVFERPKIMWENILFALANKLGNPTQHDQYILSYSISKNINLPREIIKLGLQNRPIAGFPYKLMRSDLMENPSVTYDIMKEAFGECNEEEKKNFWENLYRNPNVTLEIMRAHVRTCIDYGNEMQWNDVVYAREIAVDIKARREFIKKIYIAGLPMSIVARYIDYA